MELKLRLTEAVAEELKLVELLGDADGLSVTELDCVLLRLVVADSVAVADGVEESEPVLENERVKL